MCGVFLICAWCVCKCVCVRVLTACGVCAHGMCVSVCVHGVRARVNGVWCVCMVCVCVRVLTACGVCVCVHGVCVRMVCV